MNQKIVTTSVCLGLICFLGSFVPAGAQPIYSSNVVGYASIRLYAGDNLIANPFDEGDNTLNTLFLLVPAGVPQGATFTEWDPLVYQYLPLSVYDAGSGWSINYTLGFGQGGLLTTPANFTNVFAGTVWSSLDLFGPFVPPLVTNSGSLLLSCYVPYANETFYDIVGRAPQNGESVTMLDAPSQTYTTTTFQNDVWNNGDPSLTIGQSAFFNLLDPAQVPEPATCGLAGLGILALAAFRRTRQKT